jgi:hypothetical protein
VLQVIVFNVIFQWSGFGELVSVMEPNPCCSIDNLYNECVSILGDDWYCAFKGVKGCRRGKFI